MKKILGAIFILCLIAVPVLAKDYEVVKRAGVYEVTIGLNKSSAVVGDNMMSIAVRDAAGKSITDAKVSVNYGMPTMPGMPAMNYKTGAQLKGGIYEAALNFSMSGSWSMRVIIDRGGKVEAARLTVDVQ